MSEPSLLIGALESALVTLAIFGAIGASFLMGK